MATTNSDETPATRPLKVYTFDPSRGTTLGNNMVISVPFYPLLSGLKDEYLEVIDYDATNDCFYEPVDLNKQSILMNDGLDPSESDPRFHQQMVYAVAHKTIDAFEFALGRKIRWGFNRTPVKSSLRLYPHGMQEANAFYSRDLKAVVFGYFPASDSDPVTNLPGQAVFTCLSHDIIAHEVTHALIDGQRSHFMEATSADTLAFHEAFADIVALFQHFTFKDVLVDVIKRTGGLIYRSTIAADVEAVDGKPQIVAELSTSNPLVQLAKQFGEAMGQRAALREALGTPPNANDLEKLFEPHDRGAILVAAVFDAFFTVYIQRVRDLLRIAGASFDASDYRNGRELHPDLANRLAGEASKTAEHFCNICIRALDYCPPVDIRFGDFLRAVITADYDLVSDDPHNYREALRDAFRLRGIRPNDVTSYAEQALRWCPPEDVSGAPLRCTGLVFDLFKPLERKQNEANARLLHKFATTHAAELGLDPNLKTAVHTFHPIHRVTPKGRVKLEAVTEITQEKKVPVDPSDPSLGEMSFFGGVTLIIDLSPDKEGEVRYAIRKSIDTGRSADERLALQRSFRAASSERFSLNVYSNDVNLNLPTAKGKNGLSFRLVHKGY